MEIIDNALVNFLLLKQKDEPLYKYVSRFKTAKEIVESHLGGPIMFSKYIKKNDLYDEKDLKIKQELNDKTWEDYVAYKSLTNANSTKYSHVIRHLKERTSIGKDEFPKTLTLATNTLSTQQFKENKQNKNENKFNQTSSKTIKKESQDYKEKNPPYALTNIEYKCYYSGETGHKSPQSPHKKK